jgi:hypothetical protein
MRIEEFNRLHEQWVRYKANSGVNVSKHWFIKSLLFGDDVADARCG